MEFWTAEHMEGTPWWWEAEAKASTVCSGKSFVR